MTKQTQFQSENFLMSVLGHLVLVVIIVSSFSVVIERAKLVTPNRIQIVEIDLKACWNKLGEIIGETYTDELINEIFSRFCLGK